MNFKTGVLDCSPSSESLPRSHSDKVTRTKSFRRSHSDEVNPTKNSFHYSVELINL